MKTPGAVLLLLLATANADDLDQLELKKIKSEVQYFEARLQASETKMREYENEIQQLKKLSKDVAFTAVLQPPFIQNLFGSGDTGMFFYDFTRSAIHQKVLTNVGQAYSPSSGIFTAPVRGVYFFTFTSHCWNMGDSILSGVKLMKNTEEILLVWNDMEKGDREEYASNSAVLSLERGDQVYLEYPKHSSVMRYNRLRNLHTFSGFLLYPTAI